MTNKTWVMRFINLILVKTQPNTRGGGGQLITATHSLLRVIMFIIQSEHLILGRHV